MPADSSKKERKEQTAKPKQIAILVEDLYQVLEVWYPLLRLQEAGITVKTIGTGGKETYGSKEGYPIKVDASIEQVKPTDFDGVIIPGGYAPDILRRYPAVINFVKRLYVDGRAVAAICHGGWLLVSAGVVKGHQVTCFFAIKDDLIAAGGKYIDRDVVVDQNLITSRKPEDLPRFVQELIKFVQKD
jgi:protease I